MTATAEQIRGRVVEGIADYYRPESNLPWWQWAEQNLVVMPSENKRLAGRFDTSHAPYLRVVYDFIQKRPPFDIYNECWIEKSSGTGITFGVLGALVAKAANRPGNFMYAINSRDDAKKVAGRQRVLFENCASFRERPAFDESHDQAQLLMKLRGMEGHFIGGGSAGQFAGKPNLEVVVLDEIDVSKISGGESQSPALARDRFKNSAEMCLIGLCKPVLFTGPIHQQYLTGTRHKFFVPCWHCNFPQELVFGDPAHPGKYGLYFDDLRDLSGNFDLELLLKHTRYRCIECQRLIDEKHKRAMVLAYDLRPTNLGQEEKYRPHPGKMSLHISDLYSQFPLATWGHISSEFVLAHGDGEKQQAWFNSRLGLPRQEQASETEEEDIHILAGPGFGQPPYLENTLPVTPALLRGDPTRAAIFKGTDVQDHGKISVVAAFDADENLYVLDYNVSFGFEELLVCSPVAAPGPDGLQRNYAVECGFIDCPHRQDEVFEFCIASQGFYYPSMGRPGVQVKGIAEVVPALHNGHKLPVHRFNDSVFKSQLYLDRIKHSVQQRKSELGLKPGAAPYISPYPRIRFFKDPDDELVKGLCKDQRVPVMIRGRRAWQWVEQKGNDPGDALKNILVAWYFMRSAYALNPPKSPPPGVVPNPPASADAPAE